MKNEILKNLIITALVIIAGVALGCLIGPGWGSN